MDDAVSASTLSLLFLSSAFPTSSAVVLPSGFFRHAIVHINVHGQPLSYPLKRDGAFIEARASGAQPRSEPFLRSGQTDVSDSKFSVGFSLVRQ